MVKLLRKASRILPDKLYLQMMYYKHFRKFIDFQNPQTFNEKLQWLKIYDRRPEYTQMVDKYRMREYITGLLGEEYLIPLLGVWDDPDEIDFDALPDQFVLKWNHDSGSVYICKDKAALDIPGLRKKLRERKDHNGFWYSREWPYKNVVPKIIAEKYMVDESGYDLKDYKVFCFHGVPELIQVFYDRQIGAKQIPYDFEWNPLHFSTKFKADESVSIPRPAALEKMREISALLSRNMPFLRVDFYEINGSPYIGELTLYPAGGYVKFNPKEYDDKLGKLLDISMIDARKGIKK